MRIATLKNRILAVIFKYLPKDKCLIFLFGSFAKNKVYPSSDIDIGIICDTPLDNSLIVKIKGELEEVKTLREIDLIDFLSIQDKEFMRIALKEAKVWHQTRKSKAYLTNLKRRISG